MSRSFPKRSLGALKRIRGLIDQETAIKAYQGFIEPYFSYCAPVWDGLGHTLSDRLQKPQNRAARVITRSSYNISSNLLLDQLKWNNLSVNRLKQKAIPMYKTLNGQTPQHLHEMFTSRRCQYPLRNSNGKLFIPKPNTDYLKRSFSYSGAILWNNLPEPLDYRHLSRRLKVVWNLYILDEPTPTRQPGRTVLFSLVSPLLPY